MEKIAASRGFGIFVFAYALLGALSCAFMLFTGALCWGRTVFFIKQSFADYCFLIAFGNFPVYYIIDVALKARGGDFLIWVRSPGISRRVRILLYIIILGFFIGIGTSLVNENQGNEVSLYFIERAGFCMLIYGGMYGQYLLLRSILLESK